jgi:arabinofuranosyltransferase
VAAAAVLPVALFLVRERLIAGAAGFPLDDSWIHLHFARNIAEGHGFSYNPGIPVAGSTAPLWTLLLAAASVLTGATLATAKVTGVLVTMAAAIVTRRAAIGWGASAGVALAAAVALLWTGPVVWGALSGMEVSLAALLVAAALWAQARARSLIVAVLLGLAALARPEALLLVPLLMFSRPLSLAQRVRFVAVVAIVVAPAVAFSLATVGAPIPATAAAKVEGGLLGWLAGVREPLATALVGRPSQFLHAWVRWMWNTNALLPLVVGAGVVGAWARHGRALGVPALALVLHPLGMAVLAPYRDPAFQEARYSLHLLPLVFVAAAVTVGSLHGRGRPLLAVGYLALALAVLPAAGERYAWGVQNINAMQVHLGRWVAARLPPSARIAVNDVGAIAFFSRRPVIDLMGLITPAIIPYRREGEYGVIRYVTETCPDYVIIFPDWFPELTGRLTLLAPIYRVRLERNEVAGAAEMVVYRLTRCTV